MTESGGQIDVGYSEPECTKDTLPKPETNTKACFPAWWTPTDTTEELLGWFHKYRVLQVVESDLVGGGGTRSPHMTISGVGRGISTTTNCSAPADGLSPSGAAMNRCGYVPVTPLRCRG